MNTDSQFYLHRAAQCQAAAEAAKDPADKAVYRLLAKAYEKKAGPGVPLSTKLLRRDLDTLKTDTAAALAAAASAPPPEPPPPPATAGRYFSVDSDGKARPEPAPKPATQRTTPVWVGPGSKVPSGIEF